MDNTIRKYVALANYIAPRAYGDVIHRQEIETVTEERWKTQRYYAAVNQAKRLLERQGKMIVSIGSGDYRVIYPGDYTAEYAREVRKAGRRLKHGDKILKHAPVKDMTEDEQQTYNRVYDFNARLSASFAGSTTEVKRLTGKKHPLENTADAVH